MTTKKRSLLAKPRTTRRPRLRLNRAEEMRELRLIALVIQRIHESSVPGIKPNIPLSALDQEFMAPLIARATVRDMADARTMFDQYIERYQK